MLCTLRSKPSQTQQTNQPLPPHGAPLEPMQQKQEVSAAQKLVISTGSIRLLPLRSSVTDPLMPELLKPITEPQFWQQLNNICPSSLNLLLEFLFLISNHCAWSSNKKKQGSSSLIPEQLMNSLLSRQACAVVTLSHLNSNTLDSHCGYLFWNSSKSLIRALQQHPDTEYSSAVQGWDILQGFAAQASRQLSFAETSTRVLLASSPWGHREGKALSYLYSHVVNYDKGSAWNMDLSF